MEYSSFNTNINKEWVHYSTLSGGFSFLHWRSSWDFLLSFVLWSFQVLCKDLMDYGTRSGKSLSLGMPMAPQDNLRTPKIQSLGMPRKASPLSSSSIGNFTWSYIFIHHMICVLLGASCIIWVFAFSLPQSSSLNTLLRETHMIRNLLEYSMCFTYIFWAR